MENLYQEGNQYLYVTSISGEDLGRDIRVRNFNRKNKISQQSLNWATKEWNYTAVPYLVRNKANGDDVTCLIYMILDGGLDRNVVMDEILLLLLVDKKNTSWIFH